MCIRDRLYRNPECQRKSKKRQCSEESCTGIRYNKEAQNQELLLEALQKNNQWFVEIDQCGDNVEVKKSGCGVQISFLLVMYRNPVRRVISNSIKD